MRNIFLAITLILSSTLSFSQTEKKNEIKMTSDYSSDNTEIRDILQFQGIEYLKLSFKGKELADKSYHLTVKEIWDGKVKSDSTIMNNKTIQFEQFQKINDTVFNLKIISKLTTEIKYGEKFYLLAYILPYEKDGAKYWCAVESSGKDIENWGKEFGIEHYLVFEMIFE
jgi:hypothetical protein